MRAEVLSPTEHQEQVVLMKWCALNVRTYPELAMIFAIPNGGDRNVITATLLKAEGVRSGVPDLFLPVARGGYHGLFIEMKRVKRATLSTTQKVWLNGLLEQGYLVEVCHGAHRAIQAIESYFTEKGR